MYRYRSSQSAESLYPLLNTAANAVVSILRQHGFSCAIIGGFACKLYGSTRYPNDVDILVLDTSHTQEWFKDIIVSANPQLFILKRAKNPLATYRILWYGRKASDPQCKIDILIPGTLNLPLLPLSHINWISGFPLVPLSVLLLHKLQGWSDNKNAIEYYKREKQYTDAADVERLMKLDAIADLRTSRPWKDEELFSQEFQQLSKKRVRLFCLIYPKCTEGWTLLGFDMS